MEGDGRQQKEISTQTCLKIEQNLPNFARMEMFKYREKPIQSDTFKVSVASLSSFLRIYIFLDRVLFDMDLI